ncbi:hypothetical protein PVAG01_07890 [Phlyctema vagabunda]|uniref:EKC/KEOPS complex subunit BUD32 n=1 Tax=Phlyctema vagabunda TaxID=108571 RepID=A0ABR4PDV0_9HELO
MIDPKVRFEYDEGSFRGDPEDPKTTVHSKIWDWDQLRSIKITGTAKIFPWVSNEELEFLGHFMDFLSPEVRSVSVDDDRLITELTTDPKEDGSLVTPYPRLSTVETLAGCHTIQFSKLEEVDRLGKGVDLSSYVDESGARQLVAFKFAPFAEAVRIEGAWCEMSLLRQIPPHENLVAFDRVVIEDKESRVIGFTTKYLTGGNFVNPDRPFRFEWLQQLTEVVDFLNLELGIMHQDIAPRNLIVDPDTHKLVLFDFNTAACGEKNLKGSLIDVSGVALTLYGLITNDIHFTNLSYWDRDMEMIESISEWPRVRELDAEVSKFRTFLDDWIVTRKRGSPMERYLKAPNPLTWFDVPEEYQLAWDLEESPPFMKSRRYVRTAKAAGEYVFCWERPPQIRLLKKAEDGK